MKVTIQSKAGEMVLDIDPEIPAEAELVLALLAVAEGGTIESPVAGEDKIPAAQPEDENVLDMLESSSQRDTWWYLRRNDRSRGVPAATIAKRYRISGSAASARCSVLVDRGYAVRVSRGYYRAIVPESIS